MAERFNLTAQLQLQGPTNTRQVANQIRKQLEPIGNINVQVQADTRPLKSASDQLNQLNKAAKQSNRSVSELNRTIAESARRFSVITVATGTLLGFVNSLKNSTKAAIEFEREVVKISQVTGKSAGNLKSLTDEVSRLATTLGTSSAELLNVSRTLLQTGLSAEKTRKALEVLAQTSLGATFDSIQDTTEGAIALLRQFGAQSRKTGTEIAFLRQSLDSINSVSKSFAVESGDLVTAIRRVGGVFAAAGGNVNELIALFTSVRATTRESAETIATGLRTIFTRIQRGETVNQLKELGIQLQDSKGNFVGAFEAFKRLSQGLSGLDPKSFRFSEIVEQLGGFRQVGKVIPLIQQFTTAQQALAVAQKATGSVARDAQTAQGSLAVQIEKTREKFDELIRTFTNSTTFRSVITFSLQLAQSFIAATRALEPLVPLLTALFALKVGKGLGTGLGALANFGRGGGGAPVSKFARGGMVPGTGNTDSVPAMLTPGEFVIRKSSVKKLGASNLAAMNQNRYSHGGDVKKQTPTSQATNFTHISEISPRRQAGIRGISSRLGGREIVKAYTNMGLDLPASWNKDWNTPRNNHGVFREKLVNYIRSKPVFKTLTGQGNSIYRLAEDNKQNQFLQGAMKKNASNIRTDLASLLTSGRRQFFDVDPEVYTSDLGPKLIKSVEKNAPELSKAVQRVSAIKTEGASRRSLAGVAKGGYKNPIASEFSKRVNRFFGGPVQKFNLGGIVNASRFGAAILEPDQNVKNETKTVGIKDVQGKIKGSGFARDRALKGLGKVYKGKKYTLVRQGLNEKTSQGFSTAIVDGAAQGIGDAVSALSSDLGLGSASFQGDAKSLLAGILRRDAIGEIYENALNLLQNKGSFKPSAPSQPFDFPAGLSGKLADNFSNLPSSWIDARSSFSSATSSAMFGKVASEIADEYKRSGEQAKASEIKRAATGGNIAGSDTVPALLTPGEFVFSKKSADKIGRGNLNRMNKQGVQGFAKGGPVGFRNGGNVAGQVQNVSFGALGLVALAQQFEILDDALGSTIAQVAGYTASIGGISSTLSQLKGDFLQSRNAAKEEASASKEVAAAKRQEAAASRLSVQGAADSAGNGAGVFSRVRNSRVGRTVGVAGRALGPAAFITGAVAQGFQAKFSQDVQAAADDIKAFGEAAKEGATVNLQEVQAAVKKESEARLNVARTSVVSTVATYAAIGSAFGPVGTAAGVLVGVFSEAENITKLLNGAREKELQLLAKTTVDSLKLSASFAKINKNLEKTEGLFGVSEDFKGAARLDAASQLGDEVRNFASSANFKLVEEALAKTKMSFSDLASKDGPALAQALKGTELEADRLSIALKSAQESNSALANAQKLAGAEFQRQLQNLDPSLSFDEALKNVGFSNAMNEYIGLIKLQQQVALSMAKSTMTTEEFNQLKAEFEKVIADVSGGARDAQSARQKASKIEQQEVASRVALVAQLEKETQILARFRSNTQEQTRRRESTAALAAAQRGERIDAGFALIDIPDVEVPLDDFIENLSRFNQNFSSLTAELNAELQDNLQKLIANREFNDRIIEGARGIAGLGEKQIEAKLGGRSPAAATAEELSKLLNVNLSEIEAIYGKEFKISFGNFLTSIFADAKIDLTEIEKLEAELKKYNKIEEVRLNQLKEVVESEKQLYEKAKILRQNEEDARERIIRGMQSFQDAAESTASVIEKITGNIRSATERETRAREFRQRKLDTGIDLRGGVELRAGDFNNLSRQLGPALQRRQELRSLLPNTEAGVISEENLEKFLLELNQLDTTVDDIEGEFKALRDTVKNAQDEIVEWANTLKKSREQQFALLQDFVIGGPDQRASLEQAARGVFLAVQTGTLQNQTPDQRSATFQFLDRLSDVFIGNTGMTGREIQRELVRQDAIRLGFSSELAEKLASTEDIEQRALDQLKTQTDLLNNINDKLLIINESNNPPNNQLQVPQFNSRGGVIYKNEGGTIFQPKGTDTVPAMLTPGEFVIRKSAVDKIGVGNLQAINSGNYLQRGGVVSNSTFRASVRRGASALPKSDLAKMLGLDNFDPKESIDDMLLRSNIYSGSKAWENYLGQVRGNVGGGIKSISSNRIRFNRLALGESKRGKELNQNLRSLLAYSESRQFDGESNLAAQLAEAGYGLNPFQQKRFLERELRKFLDTPKRKRRERRARQAEREAEEKKRTTPPTLDEAANNYKRTGKTGAYPEMFDSMEAFRDFQNRAKAEGEKRKPRYREPVQEAAKKDQKVQEKQKSAADIDFEKAQARRAQEISELQLENVRLQYKQDLYQAWKNSGSTATFDEWKATGAMGPPKKSSATERIKDLENQEARLMRQANQIINYTEAGRRSVRTPGGMQSRPLEQDAYEVTEKTTSISGGSGTLGRPFTDVTTYDEYGPSVKDQKASASNEAQNLKNQAAAIREKIAALRPEATKEQRRQLDRNARESRYLQYLLGQGLPVDEAKAKLPPDSIYYAPNLASSDIPLVSKISKLARFSSLSGRRGSPKKIAERRIAERRRIVNRGLMFDESIPRQGGRTVREGFGGLMDSMGQQLATDFFGINNLASTFGIENLDQKIGLNQENTNPFAQALFAPFFGRKMDDMNVEALGGGSSPEARAFALSVGLAGALFKPLKFVGKAVSTYSKAARIRGPGGFFDKVGAKYRNVTQSLDDFGKKTPTPTPTPKPTPKTQTQTPAGDVKPLDAFFVNLFKRNKAVKETIREGSNQSLIKEGVESATKTKAAGKGDLAKELNKTRGRRVEIEDGNPIVGKDVNLSKVTAKNPRINATAQRIAQQAKEEAQGIGLKIDAPTGKVPAKAADDALKFDSLSQPKIFEEVKLVTDKNGLSRWMKYNRDTKRWEFATRQTQLLPNGNRFANGGGVPGGNDRVPAMLTPGEFIMSPEAVNKYGVGYMKSLNRGRVPGFRRGGIVGRGNVQYHNDGGMIGKAASFLGIDTSKFEGILGAFNNTFESLLMGITGQFAGLGSSITSLANVFSKGMNMSHTFSGDMTIAFSITNLPELQEAISKAMQPKIEELIIFHLSEQNKQLRS